MARPNEQETVTKRGVPKLKITKDKILTTCGLTIIGFELINSEALGRSFHPEFLFTGLALCGIGIAQYLDRGGR